MAWTNGKAYVGMMGKVKVTKQIYQQDGEVEERKESRMGTKTRSKE